MDKKPVDYKKLTRFSVSTKKIELRIELTVLFVPSRLKTVVESSRATMIQIRTSHQT